MGVWITEKGLANNYFIQISKSDLKIFFSSLWVVGCFYFCEGYLLFYYFKQ